MTGDRISNLIPALSARLDINARTVSEMEFQAEDAISHLRPDLSARPNINAETICKMEYQCSTG